MKKMIILLLAAVLMAATRASATDAALLMSALNANPATNRVVEHQRLQPFPGNLVSNWSGSSGLVVISNVDVGDYNVWIRQRGQSGQIAFSFTITTNDSGTVWVHTNNLSVINVGTYPKTGQAAWSIAAAESRYARKGEAGGAAVTGAELVETSTNNGVVTTLVRTQAVQQLTVSGSTNAQNAANATNLYPSGPLSVNFNGGTLTSGNAQMAPGGFTVANGGSLTPSGFTGSGAGLTNVTADYVSGTLTNNTTGNAATATTSTSATTSTNSSFSQQLVWRTTNALFDTETSVKVMPLPPRIYRTWIDFTTYPSATNVTENYVIATCEWFATNGVRDAGCEWIMIEEGWQGTIGGDGTWATTSTNFPSGMAYIANEIKKRGFRPAIYTSLRANDPSISCMGHPATTYNNLNVQVKQFADWGFDFVMFDNCSGDYDTWTTPPAGYTPAQAGDYAGLHAERIRLVADAVAQAGRPLGTLITFKNTPEGYYYVTNLSEFARPTIITPNYAGLATDFLQNDIYHIARLHAQTLPSIQSFTRPGHYTYGTVPSYSQNNAPCEFGYALECMLQMAISVQSSQTRPNMSLPINLSTNKLASLVHRDPSFNKAFIAWTNSTGQIWVRQVGDSPAVTNAVVLANWDSSPQTFYVSNKWFGWDWSVPVAYNDIWHGTNVTIVTSGGVAAITVAASNSLFLTASRPIPRSVETVFHPSAMSLTGTGASQQNFGAQGPSPFFSWVGISQSAANNYWTMAVPVPTWANNIMIRYDVTAGTGVAWTNEFTVDVYRVGSRQQLNSGNHAYITNVPVVTTSGSLSPIQWGVNLPSGGNYIATNTPKVVNIIVAASTNNGARYMIGPVTARFME